jgi:hypothetical protein
MTADLETVILGIPKTGWRLADLSGCGSRWACDLVPAHFGGDYYWGNPVKSPFTTYPMAQARITGGGATPVAAIQDALERLGKARARQVYVDLLQALEDRIDGFSGKRDQAGVGRRTSDGKASGQARVSGLQTQFHRPARSTRPAVRARR